jgi:hypothetical protein
LFVWLSCVLSAGMLALPVMLAFQPNELRCEDSDPVDASEKVDAAEVSLVDSSRAKRRLRCHRHEWTRTNSVPRCVAMVQTCPPATRQTTGQVSLRGRCGPLHC